MNFIVFGLTYDLKVFNAIVMRVIIDMMDNLCAFKGASKMLLHNPSVVVSLFSVNFFKFVLLMLFFWVLIFRKVFGSNFIIAFHRAMYASDSVRVFSKLFFTRGA